MGDGHRENFISRISIRFSQGCFAVLYGKTRGRGYLNTLNGNQMDEPDAVRLHLETSLMLGAEAGLWSILRFGLFAFHLC